MLLRPLLLIVSVVAVLALAGPASASVKHAELRYAYATDHFTKLTATAPVKVTVKRPHQHAKATTLKALVGVKLPIGTKITVRSAIATWTLKIVAGGVV